MIEKSLIIVVGVYSYFDCKSSLSPKGLVLLPVLYTKVSLTSGVCLLLYAYLNLYIGSINIIINRIINIAHVIYVPHPKSG